MLRGEPGMNQGYISHIPGLHRGDIGSVRTHFIFFLKVSRFIMVYRLSFTRVYRGPTSTVRRRLKRVTVDIVGPIEPRSEKRNRYILTMIDYAPRHPEAVALPSIETEHVAEALVEMLSRVGIPDEMLTDCWCQFTAEVMKEVSRLLSLQKLTTTLYHPMCNV